MENSNPPYDIRERCIEFALRVKRLSQFIFDNGIDNDREVADQMARSALSVGANLHEAIGAESTADFVHKYQISLKEAQECLYWIRIVKGSGLLEANRILPLETEAQSICKILGTITSKLKRKRGVEQMEGELKNMILPTSSDIAHATGHEQKPGDDAVDPNQTV